MKYTLTEEQINQISYTIFDRVLASKEDPENQNKFIHSAEIADLIKLEAEKAHPIDTPVDYSNMPKSKTGMIPGTLSLDGGYQGSIDIYYNHLPREEATGANGDIEIDIIIINGHVLPEKEMEKYLSPKIFYDPEWNTWKADNETVEDVIKFKIKDDMYQQDLSM